MSAESKPTQPEALRLADRLDANPGDTRKQAAAELRRQHQALTEMREALTILLLLSDSERLVPKAVMDRALALAREHARETLEKWKEC